MQYHRWAPSTAWEGDFVGPGICCISYRKPSKLKVEKKGNRRSKFLSIFFENTFDSTQYFIILFNSTRNFVTPFDLSPKLFLDYKKITNLSGHLILRRVLSTQTPELNCVTIS
jgi:hypothetical protein